MTNIIFYGETEAHDCPYPNYCAQPNDGKFDCVDKSAIITSIFDNYNPPPIITAPPHWPQYKYMEEGSLGGYTNYQSLKFINFNSSTTYCGRQQTLFTLNLDGADYIPTTNFYDTKFVVSYINQIIFYRTWTGTHSPTSTRLLTIGQRLTTAGSSHVRAP